MRIDLYLRSLKGKKGREPGAVRRALRRLGHSWEQAPARRLTQAFCFLAFVVLFLVVAWPYGSPDYAENLARKELVDAELFLALDPLVSISTAIAARTWVWSLVFAGAMLLVGLVFPRGFCGYLCPLGTLIDLFDWAVGRRVQRFRVEGEGWWVHLRFYLLAAVLAAAACGVLLTGFVAAIPVLTRGFMFVLGPFQTALLRDWYLIPPLNAGHVVSIVLFLGVLALGFLKPRFWCRHVCPTGALFSTAAFFRLTERQVTETCLECGICVKVCSFDAIRPDFGVRTEACTFCQTCAGACPAGAIHFVDRWSNDEAAPLEAPAPRGAGKGITRRGLAAGAAAGVLSALAVRPAWGADTEAPGTAVPIRPPGSVPEADFLAQCIRCTECLQACPNDVLQSQGFQQGLEGLWTPVARFDWSGCDSKCANCGQVCPTGAIRALPLEEKAAARMGLAIVDEAACLPHAAREACQMCVDECEAAGYRAIEFVRVHPELDEDGFPLPDTGYAAPVVIESRCVGCGLCQSRCRHINADEKGVLAESAIVVQAGPGREDRVRTGSYVEMRKAREQPADDGVVEDSGDYLPDFLDDG